jgi:hypothetical protein
LRRAHRGIFAFALFCDFCFCFCSFAQTLHLTFASLSLGMRQAKEKILAGLKTLAENFGALQKFRRFLKI